MGSVSVQAPVFCWKINKEFLKFFLVLAYRYNRSVFADEFPVKSEVGSYDPEFGVFLGELPNLADGDVSGKVYIINDTALQILNFTYNGKAPGMFFVDIYIQGFSSTRTAD